MPEQDFLAFGIGAGANVEDQPTWATDPVVTDGFAAGLAISPKFNKAWRQSSVIARTIGQFISDELVTENVLDNGDLATLLDQYKRALEKLVWQQYKTPVFNNPQRFYVNTATGNDNDAETNGGGTDPAHPFKTIGACVGWIGGHINANGNQLIVSIAAGTYLENILIEQPITGAISALQFEATGGTVAWNGVTGLGCTLGCTHGAAAVIAGGTWQFGFGGALPASAPGAIFYTDFGSAITVEPVLSPVNITYANTTGGPHILTQGGSAFAMSPISIYPCTYTISGNAGYHVYCSLGSRVVIEGFPAVTLVGTPHFSGAFCQTFDLGVSYLVNNNYIGAATGLRFSVSGNAIIQTQGSNPLLYLPGNSNLTVLADGTYGTGGRYL